MPTFREIKVDDLGGKKRLGRQTSEARSVAKSRELSDLVVGERFHINSIADLKDNSPKSQKKRAAERVMETVEKIKEVYTKDIEDAARIKQIEAQLKETKVWKALVQLRTARKKNKKTMNDLTNIYLGGVEMLKAIGIPLDGGTVKSITTIIRKEE